MDQYQNELVDYLKKGFEECNVVVMPDFFMDRLINLNYDVSHFSNLIHDKVLTKGGSIDYLPQVDQFGGNAINVALSLTALGIKVTPIICTNRFGFEQLSRFFSGKAIDFSHTKLKKRASITTALEFDAPEGKVNVMLRDVGSLSDFGPSNLNKADFKVISDSDYVCLFNWVGTKKFGTQLARELFRHVKTRGKGKTYFAPADPTPNRKKIPELIKQVLKSNVIDILSLNENEAFTFASLLDNEIIAERENLSFDDLALNSARILARELNARLDLHTTRFSATITTNHEVIVPAFSVNVLRATGAGDAWDAGNIIGDANNFPDGCRLALANAISAYYLSDRNGGHPTCQQLVDFIQRTSTIPL